MSLPSCTCTDYLYKEAFREIREGNTVTWHNLVPVKNQQRTLPAKRAQPPPAAQAAAAPGAPHPRAAVRPPAAVSRPAVPSAAPRPQTWPAASCWWGWVCFALRSCLCPGRIFGARCAAGTLAFSVSRLIWSDRSCCTWPTCWPPATALRCLRARYR